MKIKLTRRTLLMDCLDMMTSFQRHLSQNWTLLEAREGCEGAWDLVKQEADMLREMIHEIDAAGVKGKVAIHAETKEVKECEEAMQGVADVVRDMGDMMLPAQEEKEKGINWEG